MPRSPTILTPPPGTLPFVPNTTIRSQDANALFNDLYQDGNTPRPIAFGGTGANNAADALINLGAVGQSTFLDAFRVGDFFGSVRDMGSNWLRRNGSVYFRDDYPELAALIPPLPDSMTWQGSSFDISPPTGYVNRGITKHSGKCVSIFNNSSGLGVYIYSSDDNGATWNAKFQSNSYGVGEIQSGNGSFVVLARNNSNQAISIWSPDGDSWSVQPISGTASYTATSTATEFHFDGNYFLFGNNGNVHRSEDGDVWVSTARPGRVVVGGNGLSLLVDAGAYYQSIDGGVTWTALGFNPFSAYGGVNVGVYDPTNDIFGYGASSGNVLTSPNGTTVTSRILVSGAGWYRGSASRNGMIFAGLNLGSVTLSIDNVSFQNFTSPGSGQTGGALCDDDVSGRFLIGRGREIFQGTRITSTQFQVPNDSPQYGWIKAKND